MRAGSVSKSLTYFAVTVFIIIVVTLVTVWSRESFEDDRKKPVDDPPLFLLSGEVTDINDAVLSVLTREGGNYKLLVTQFTSFVTEVSIEKNQIKDGDRLVVIGPSIEGTFEIRILADEKNQQRKSVPSHKLSVVNIPAPPEPPIGNVINSSPLTIKLSSGETRGIVITERTRLVKEIPITLSEIKKAEIITAIAPSVPGRKYRIAEKIILHSNNKSLSHDKTKLPFNVPPEKIIRSDRYFNPDANFSRKGLLADLQQQPEKPEFIYGAWLGRGIYTNNELERAFNIAINLGVKYLKVEFKWGFIQTEENKWQWNNEKTLNVEKVIELAKKFNISIIPYFDTFMPWGSKKRLKQGECEGNLIVEFQSQSPSPEAYANYVFSVIDKLIQNGVIVNYIELDNEVSNISDGYRSWDCLINMTAKQIKEVENAAYDKIKSKYPHVWVSSTSFALPGIAAMSGLLEEKRGKTLFLPNQKHIEYDQKRRNSFLKAYLSDGPKPKFDFLALHEGGGENPYTTQIKTNTAKNDYNFGSYYELYNVLRKALDDYGYRDRPILNTENSAILKGAQSAEIIQKIVFARSNETSNKVIGYIANQISGSKEFTEGSPDEDINVGITRLYDDYKLADGYYGYYSTLKILSKYPKYNGKINGELNTQKPWVEKFSNNEGDVLLVAFVPYRFSILKPQIISLRVGIHKEIKVTKADTTFWMAKSNKEGYIALNVDIHPLFIEISK